MHNNIEIEYCHGCRWLTRSAWMAQELLITFAAELNQVSLQPATESGKFEVRCNGRVIWSRKTQGGFPQISTLKQLVRDQVAPGKSLGHIDR